MRVLGVVPARAGSRRVPGKNLRKLGQRELVGRSVDACRAAKGLTQICVSSDSEEVLALARREPGVVVIRRPAEISGDQAMAVDFVLHALSVVETGGAPHFDAVVIVQPSSPFTRADDIDASIDLLARTPEADSVVTVMELDHATHPFKLKRLEGDRLVPFFAEEAGRTASHQLPKLYVRNGSVYATRRASIDARSILGEDSRAVVMPRERSVDINDELDWAFAEFLFSRGASG